MTQHVAVDEEYLLVEEVADRLGLPLALLLRRVEAGDIPARRIENENGVHYSLRLSDLGIEDASPVGPDREADVAPPVAVDEPQESDLPMVDLTGRRVDGEQGGMEDHREPAQPAPPWLHDAESQSGPGDGEGAATPASAWEPLRDLEPPVVEDSGGASVDDDGEAQPPLESAHGLRPDLEAPVPAAVIAEQRSPHGDLSAMSLDARELVAGLLDRWERTLEQRIYTEQRQRFQGELAARQNMVKQLQMELHTVRAEHAAAQAQKDRQLAEKERELADRDRQLSEARRLAEETERLLAPAASARRRRWFWQREV